jgi:type IX secretion system PorP/SprF family membrane protein
MQMKFIFTFLSFCLFVTTLSAQLEPSVSHFMHNKLFYNPATAGENTINTLHGLYRKQWIGFAGAPTIGLLSWQNAFAGDKIGVGANLLYHEIGIHKRTQADFAFSYRITLLNGTISCGLQSSFRHLQQNWADERLVGTQSVMLDQAIPGVQSSKIIPNFGAGIYYETERYYIGIAVPRMVKNDVDISEFGNQQGKEPRNFYQMAGFTHQIAPQVQMIYHVMGNYVVEQPFDLDINATVQFNRLFNAGLTYRLGGDEKQKGESIDVLAGVQVNPLLMVSASYDMHLGGINSYQNGSIELLMRYTLQPISPRFGNKSDVPSINPRSN